MQSMMNTLTKEKKTRVVPATVRRRFCLVFDVETTGLLPKRSARGVSLAEYPHILQLSFVMYDLHENRICKTYDSYIRVGGEVVISEYVQNLTGISPSICVTTGKDIVEVLYNFYQAYIMCDVLVAHNMDFDEKMILVEMERNRIRIGEMFPEMLVVFNPVYEETRGLERFCTMRKGTTLCGLSHSVSTTTSDTVNGSSSTADIMVEKKPKWPKLAELYAKLFDGTCPEGLHNSMNDVMATLRCYLKMRHNYVLGV